VLYVNDVLFCLPLDVQVGPAVATIPTHDFQSMTSDPYFIHTAVLPTLNVTLFDALVTDLPLCGNAMDCIRADANHVNKIVGEIATFTMPILLVTT
jgi:hypothetical protein